MATAILVRSEIDAGMNLIKALDKGGFRVAAALWLFNGDTEKWRMVIAFRGDRSELEKKYLDAATISAAWRKDYPGEPLLDLSRVRITSVDDPLIRGLKPVAPVEGLSEVRVSHRLLDGIYVEDAIIHRLAA